MSDTPIASAESGNGAPAAVANAPAPAAESSWYSGYDADTVGWLENRGLTKVDQSEALKNLTNGFRNAEKYIGAPSDKLVRLPDFDKADKVELDQFYGKLGRPSDAKEYNLQVPEGEGRDFAEWAQGTFHEAGLSKHQANALTAKWNEYVAGVKEGENTSYQEKVAMQEASLKNEWGQAYDKQMGLAKNAAQSLGLDRQKVDALEKALGYDGLMKMLADVGAKTGESEFISGNSSFNGPMTPNQALSKIETLKQDKEWVGKYLAGNTEAKAEMERLIKMAYPS